jgi:hypothetical protein
MDSGVLLREEYRESNYINTSLRLLIRECKSLVTHGPGDGDTTGWQWHEMAIERILDEDPSHDAE